MHDFKNVHNMISLIVMQIFQINGFKTNENDINENFNKLFSVSLDICFHNLKKYLIPLNKSDNNAKELNSIKINTLTNEDSELLINTFSVFNLLIKNYIIGEGNKSNV